MAWPLRAALVVAALVRAVAEVEPSCPAGELSCEQDEVGMLQSSLGRDAPETKPVKPLELVRASRGDDDPLPPPPPPAGKKAEGPHRKKPAARKPLELIRASRGDDDPLPPPPPPAGKKKPAARKPGAATLSQKKKAKITIRRATKKSHQSLSDVWDQMKGSVEIDQITAALEKATGMSKEELTQKLAELKEAFPAADEIKEKFSAQWDEITKGVNMQELQSAVESAKKTGAAKLGELQDKLEEAMKNVNLEDVQEKAQQTWDDLSDQLPEMDDLKGTLDQYRGQIEDMWNEFSSSDLYNQAADAASQAWGTVTGWFGR